MKNTLFFKKEVFFILIKEHAKTMLIFIFIGLILGTLLAILLLKGFFYLWGTLVIIVLTYCFLRKKQLRVLYRKHSAGIKLVAFTTIYTVVILVVIILTYKIIAHVIFNVAECAENDIKSVGWLTKIINFVTAFWNEKIFRRTSKAKNEPQDDEGRSNARKTKHSPKMGKKKGRKVKSTRVSPNIRREPKTRRPEGPKDTIHLFGYKWRVTKEDLDLIRPHKRKMKIQEDLNEAKYVHMRYDESFNQVDFTNRNSLYESLEAMSPIDGVDINFFVKSYFNEKERGNYTLPLKLKRLQKNLFLTYWACLRHASITTYLPNEISMDMYWNGFIVWDKLVDIYKSSSENSVKTTKYSTLLKSHSIPEELIELLVNENLSPSPQVAHLLKWAYKEFLTDFFLKKSLYSTEKFSNRLEALRVIFEKLAIKKPLNQYERRLWNAGEREMSDFEEFRDILHNMGLQRYHPKIARAFIRACLDKPWQMLLIRKDKVRLEYPRTSSKYKSVRAKWQPIRKRKRKVFPGDDIKIKRCRPKIYPTKPPQFIKKGDHIYK